MASAKKVLAVVRIQQKGGAADISKLGPAFGPYGVNIALVAKTFNEATREFDGMQVAADITIFEDHSFEIATRQPTVAALIKKEIGLNNGSSTPGRGNIGTVSRDILEKVAKKKMPDLNTKSIDAAIKIVAGTAKSMGLEVQL